MKNLIKTCMVLSAFAGLMIVPSVASAIQLTAPTGTTVPDGTFLIATSIPLNPEKPAETNHTLFTTNIGTITCETATLTGKQLAHTANHVLGEITTAQFDSALEGGRCTSPVGNVLITPSHTSNSVHNGQASLPWCITVEKEDKIQVWGRASTGGVCTTTVGATGPTFEFHSNIAGTCAYKKEAAGPLTATYTTHPNDAAATVNTGQKYIKSTGGAFCPAEGELHMKFTLTTDNEDKDGNPIYIDS